MVFMPPGDNSILILFYVQAIPIFIGNGNFKERSFYVYV